jgi:hypothetical protein
LALPKFEGADGKTGDFGASLVKGSGSKVKGDSAGVPRWVVPAWFCTVVGDVVVDVATSESGVGDGMDESE